MALIPQPTREQQPWILSTIPQTFVLRILNPTQVLFVGKVKAFASQNRMGQFDVLPGHTNIISIIYKRLIIYPENGQPREFDIDTGILRFMNNSCELYLGIETTKVMKDLPQFDFAQIAQETQEKIDQREVQQRALKQ
ncbi:MAG: hypothetical protein ABFQ62_03870 [Patescibacteria group bacterium]